MNRIALSIIFIMGLLAGGCAQMEYALRQEGFRGLKKPVIRVRILEGTAQVAIGAKGSFIVRTWDLENEKSAYYSASPVAVKAESGKLTLTDQKGNQLERKVRKIVIVADQKKWLWLNDKKFRGILEFYPEDNGKFYAVNVLHVEDYLRGVLQPEIGNRTNDEQEAVKAQAVAARTYALTTRDKYPDKKYDLINDIVDQVYIGADGEHTNTNDAVRQTRGEVLMYEDSLIDAYYHSTCAGNTDNIEAVWEKSAKPYLLGVSDSAYCSWSKYYTWTEQLPVSEFLSHVRSYLKSNGGESAKLGSRLKTVEIVGRTPGQRVVTLSITTDRGIVALKKDQIRWAIGRHERGGILPSSNFDVELIRGNSKSIDQVLLTGHGYGHGVGMCQCGAIGMARVGYDYRSILSHYYTGVRIEKLY